MATENEKGWNGLRQEAIREEMRNSMGLFLLCLFFSPLAFCTLSRPGRLVGRRALESEAAFGFVFPFPSWDLAALLVSRDCRNKGLLWNLQTAAREGSPMPGGSSVQE